MPSRNKDKILKENSTYHAYNRGHDKRVIFKDSHDYYVFIYLLRKYLEPGFQVRKASIVSGIEIVGYFEANHLYNQVSLIGYCLMPNHFHLLLHLKTRLGMSKLISRIASSYSNYYCKKYSLVGSVWQGTYRAVHIKNDEQLLSVLSYIHANPMDIVEDPYTYRYSSLSLYVKRPVDFPKWIEQIEYNVNEHFRGYLKKRVAPKKGLPP